MINSKFKTSPKYSFGREKKFFKMRQLQTPGPNNYNPFHVFFWTYNYNKIGFPHDKRRPIYINGAYTPGPGKYDIKRNEDLTTHKNGPKFGKGKRFLDDDNIDDNLFLPTNY